MTEVKGGPNNSESSRIETYLNRVSNRDLFETSQILGGKLLRKLTEYLMRARTGRRFNRETSGSN